MNKVTHEIHPVAEKAVDKIRFCIIDYIVSKKYKASIKDVEYYLGMQNYTMDLPANIIRELALEGAISIKDNVIHADKARLIEIKEQKADDLPENYNRLWSDSEVIIMCEGKLDGLTDKMIAEKLKRTTNSVRMMCTAMRKAYQFSHLLKESEAVRRFASIKVSPTRE